MTGVKQTYPSLRFFANYTDGQGTTWLATSHGLFFKTAHQPNSKINDTTPDQNPKIPTSLDVKIRRFKTMLKSRMNILITVA